jgi:mannosyltransferase OCH1-like enzyme
MKKSQLIIILLIILIIIYWVDFLEFKENFNSDSYSYISDELAYLSKKFELKENYDKVIPLKLYQTWFTKNLPEKMALNVEKLKKDNPEFEYYLFDDDDCRKLIKDNFDSDVLNAFDSLIPGAFKADLWRYCILYINGGIYLDIKYGCKNGFKLIGLTEKEHFCNDWSNNTVLNDIGCDQGIYNAIMVCKPKNNILLKSIYQIVDNVKNKYYGTNPLEPTGPYLLKKYFEIEDRKKFELNFYKRVPKKFYIRYGLFIILEEYPEYRSEQNNSSPVEHYDICWKNFNVYN